MKPWVGKCNRCRRLHMFDQYKSAKYRGNRRCGYFIGTSKTQCGGFIHGVRGIPRATIQAAYKIGGFDAVKALVDASNPG